MTRLVVAAFVLPLGCAEFDVVALEPREPFASGSVVTTESELRQGVAEFSFNPGIGSGGRPRPVNDPAIRIGDESVLPLREDQAGSLVYATALSHAAVVNDWLAVEFPLIETRAATVLVPLVSRVGAMNLTIAADADLLLEIMLPDDLPGDTNALWTLQLRDRCDGSVLHTAIAGRTVPASTLAIPPSLRPGEDVDSFAACLTVQMNSPQNQGGYGAEIISRSEIRWSVAVRK